MPRKAPMIPSIGTVANIDKPKLKVNKAMPILSNAELTAANLTICFAKTSTATPMIPKTLTKSIKVLNT